MGRWGRDRDGPGIRQMLRPVKFPVLIKIGAVLSLFKKFFNTDLP